MPLKKSGKKIREDEKNNPSSILMGMTGMGCDSDRVLILSSEDYSAYSRYIGMIKQHPLMEVGAVKSFVIDLSDESQFLPLTLSSLARYINEKTKIDKEST